MDIRDMKHFYAIVEAGNISSAAKRLNMAQPPLSKQMKQLEERLGVQLFERGSRKIRLTEAGHLLRERAEEILGLVDGALLEIAQLGSAEGGILSIGTVATSGATVLPALLEKFHRLYPNVAIQLKEGDGLQVLELLEKRSIEIGIIRTPFDEGLYDSVLLPDEPLVLAMKRNGRLCGEEPCSVRLSELAGQPLIVPLRWRSMFSDFCDKAGVKPEFVCISDGILLNLILLKMGMGMALVPKSAEGLLSDGELIYKEIIEPAIFTKTAIVWKRSQNLSAGGKQFLKLVKERLVQY